MKKWKITYEKYCKAVEKIYSAVQPQLKYSLICNEKEDNEYNSIYLAIDNDMEGYKIKVSKAEGDEQNIRIVAEDEINLLYAVSDFKNKYMPYAKDSSSLEPGYFFHELFTEPMKEYELVEKPKIKQRGLWTWGYVIYDYKKYIDNMVTLKFNTLIIWNDYLPVNIRDVISYAHENGVKIYLGFSWGWDTSCGERDAILHTDEISQNVVNTFEKEYMNLDCDGIYFQSFTELKGDTLKGLDVAKTVTEFVNKTAELIFEKKENLKLLFGLHATSVKNKLDIIKNVDNRISIIWEDMGSFPYSYYPAYTEGFEETKELTRKTQSLRDGGFGVVLKGVYCLDWINFKHQEGQYMMGSYDKKYLKDRLEGKKEIIKRIQAYWIKNAKYAHELIKEFDENSMVTILAEDGVFEDFINYPLALYSQMLWDSERDLGDIMCETAMMSDVEFI